jgi:hypothetical protein
MRRDVVCVIKGRSLPGRRHREVAAATGAATKAFACAISGRVEPAPSLVDCSRDA